MMIKVSSNALEFMQKYCFNNFEVRVWAGSSRAGLHLHKILLLIKVWLTLVRFGLGFIHAISS